MRHRQVLIAGLFVLSIGLPPSAWAAWPFPTNSGILLGYGQSYALDGGAAVHRGIDIAAPAGSSVYAPAAGEVSFAGLVPGESGQVLCVSVKTNEGLTVTCMPFGSVSVAAGEDIAAGSLLGALAEDGDRSSSQSHVHVSVRREQTYLDPTSVLSGVEASGDDASDGSGSGVQAPTSDEVVAPSEPAPLNNLAAASVVSGAIRASGEDHAGATTPRLANVASTQDAVGAQGTSPKGNAVPLASATGVGETTLDVSLPAQTEQQDIRSQHATSRGFRGVLNRLASSGDSRRSALVATGGCLVAVMGLWPLWRKGSNPAFSYGVRPTLDDVAAAVGR